MAERDDGSAESKGVKRVRFTFHDSDTPPPPGVSRFVYSREEILKLGDGDAMRGFQRLAQAVLSSGRTPEEYGTDVLRPLQEELDTLPPTSFGPAPTTDRPS